jgi:hypothetical protein
VLLLGKGGARELNYSSDVDLIFLSEGRDDAAKLVRLWCANWGKFRRRDSFIASICGCGLMAATARSSRPLAMRFLL